MDDHWLTRPKTIRILWLTFIAILAATVLAEFAFHFESHFGIDGSFAFNAWFGFIACVVLVIGSKMLGAMLKRPDTYYKDGGGDD